MCHNFAGKAYSVINKRRGKVVEESIREGTDTFIINALLPVVESFGLVDDLRKNTSGAATCEVSVARSLAQGIIPVWNACQCGFFYRANRPVRYSVCDFRR